MKATSRVILCLALMTAGVAGQATLEALSTIERPPLRRPLASFPRELEGWVGRDTPVKDDVLRESQATEYLSRVYENPAYPGVALSLWVNYSLQGTNMRHSPEVCLPSAGWTKVESQTQVIPIPGPDGRDVPVTRLGYTRGESVQGIGFWYYIFGEGKIERWVRGLPVTSRSSHGRTTRGSGLTVEVFWATEFDGHSDAIRDFARAMTIGLDPIMPSDRAEYYVP